MCPLPRPQVRPGHAEGLLRPGGDLLEHRLQGIPQGTPEAVQKYDEAQAKVDKKNTELKRKRRALADTKSDADKDAAKAELKKLQAELDQLKKELPAKYAFVHGLTEGKSIANMRVHLRGNPATLGAEAPRRFLEILSSPEQLAFSSLRVADGSSWPAPSPAPKTR